MPVWTCGECGKMFLKSTPQGLAMARDNHERKHRREQAKCEKITIAGYEVPLYLVERYMRTNRGMGNKLEAHQQIYDWLASKYKDAKKYCYELSGPNRHMHLEIAQRILDGEFDMHAEFKPLARFQVELDKVCEELWAKECRRNRR